MQLELEMHEPASIPEVSVHPPQQNKLYYWISYHLFSHYSFQCLLKLSLSLQTD